MRRGPVVRMAYAFVALSLIHCGYTPAYGGKRPTVRLTVSAASTLVPESGALAAVLNGVRQELSRAGVLRPGSDYPRAVVELLRVDERAAGIAVQPASPDATPLGRGSVVGVTARAWVELAPGERAYRDTGDVRRVTTTAASSSLAQDAALHDQALESAALSAGRALGRRLLGEVEPTVEPL